MVTIVIHQHGLAASGRKLAIVLEATADAFKARQRGDDGLIVDAIFRCHRDGGGGIQRIVATR